MPSLVQSLPRFPAKLISRGIAVSLIIAITSLIWDAWWHIAIGRDTFWEPPHLFLYASVIFAMVLGIYGYVEKKEPLWRNLVIVLALIPLSAPFDDLWHRMFGVENLSTPLIVWSPPHLVLFGALIGSCILILPILRRDNVVFEHLLGAPLFATALSLLMLLAGPFYPFGPYKLFSFWGAGVSPTVFILGYLVARDWLSIPGGAMLVSIISLVLYHIYDAIPGPNILIPTYPHIPGFIIAFSYILPAILLDVTKGEKISRVTAGIIAGLIYGIITYTVGYYFVDYAFRYSIWDMALAVISCAVGGVAAGWLSIHAVKKLHNLLG